MKPKEQLNPNNIQNQPIIPIVEEQSQCKLKQEKKFQWCNQEQWWQKEDLPVKRVELFSYQIIERYI